MDNSYKYPLKDRDYRSVKRSTTRLQGNPCWFRPVPHAVGHYYQLCAVTNPAKNTRNKNLLKGMERVFVWVEVREVGVRVLLLVTKRCGGNAAGNTNKGETLTRGNRTRTLTQNTFVTAVTLLKIHIHRLSVQFYLQ